MIRKFPLTETGPPLQVKSDMQPVQTRITLSQQLSAGLRHLEQHITLLPEPYACCILFFTVSAPGEDACVFFVRRVTLEAAWREGSTRVRQWAWVRKLNAVELRIDWPQEILVITGPLPPPVQGSRASAWALADDDLEHAELISPRDLPHASQALLDIQLKNWVAPGDSPAVAPVNLLLRLQGLDICSNGVQTALTGGSPLPPGMPPRPTSR